jgi:zinc-ribbon domain
MYCPSCGTEASDQTKYCTKCGVNLRRVKGVLGKGGASARDGNEWGPVWSETQNARIEERRKRSSERRKKTPEEKRLDEIKSGVITTASGFGLLIFLNLLFSAIASTIDGPEANILRSLWAVGLVPFMVGLGVIFNGLFVSKRIVELKREQERENQQSPLFSAPNASPVARLVEPSQFPISDFSVTETTTTKLREPVPATSPQDIK